MYHYSGHNTEVLNLPVYAAAVGISEGTLLIPGVTADQDMGVLIPAPGAGTNVATKAVGIANRTIANADRTDANPDGGTDATFGTLEPVALIHPGDLLCIDYNDTVQIDVASYSAPTVTITSLQDVFDGGWIYVAQDVSTETGIGQLGYLEVSASGSVGVRDNFTTALDSTSDVIMILPAGRLLVARSAVSATRGTELNTYAASTNYVTLFSIIKNEFIYNGKNGWVQMIPQLHSNMQLSGLVPRFRAVGYLRDTAAAAID